MFGKPDSMTDAECHSLPVRIEEVCYENGIAQQFVSAWLPTPYELQRLNDGAAVHLTIIGMAHPPVMLTVGTNEL